MGINKEIVSDLFEVKIVIRGPRAAEIRKIVEDKKEAERRPTNSNTVEAIIFEYANIVKEIKTRKKPNS